MANPLLQLTERSAMMAEIEHVCHICGYAWNSIPVSTCPRCKPSLAAPLGSAELLENAWDIGMISGVLQGIELTPTLLTNQKEAIADARRAIRRIDERNRALVARLALSQNDKADRPEAT